MHGAKGHFVRGGIPDPSRLCVRVSGTDIGIGQLKNVLAVRMLLIGGGVHLFWLRGGVMGPSIFRSGTFAPFFRMYE